MSSTSSEGKIKVAHIINSMAFGGAEMMLGNLMLRVDRERFDPTVIMLIDDRSLAQPVIDAGVPLSSVGMNPGVPDPRGLARLTKLLKKERPALVQTWMDHSNLIGGLAARAALGSAVRVVWGVHHSDHVPGLAKRTTLWTVATCAALSRWIPNRIVLVSEASRRLYGNRGFAAGRMEVIPNGFDTDLFRPDPAARLRLRAELGLDPEATLVGLVARYDPNKDHANFLRAAAIVAGVFREVRFVLCGRQVDSDNPALVRQVETLGLSDRCHLLGPRHDVARIHAALDVEVSSSLSEAFPLAIGEAMACGVACAATDVGDTALIVGPCGRITPPRDPKSLAMAIAELLALPSHERRRLGMTARQRISELFDLTAITRRYESLYLDLAAAGTRAPDAAGPATAVIPQPLQAPPLSQPAG